MSEGRLHFEVHGDRGPYLLLVHGMLASRAQWAPNLAALARVARPVVVELLGHGRSASPEAPAAYAPASYTRAFEAIRTSLGVDRWLVCGTSLGAALSLRYALDRPERVVAHAFTNTNSGLADAEWMAQTTASMQAFHGLVEAEGLAALEKLPVHPIHGRRLPEALKQSLVDEARRLSPMGVARTALHTIPDSSVRERVGELRSPTLMLHGVREERFAEAAAYARATIADLEVASLDAGHAVNLEAADAFDQALCSFVARF